MEKLKRPTVQKRFMESWESNYVSITGNSDDDLTDVDDFKEELQYSEYCDSSVLVTKLSY